MKLTAIIFSDFNLYCYFFLRSIIFLGWLIG